MMWWSASRWEEEAKVPVPENRKLEKVHKFSNKREQFKYRTFTGELAQQERLEKWRVYWRHETVGTAQLQLSPPKNTNKLVFKKVSNLKYLEVNNFFPFGHLTDAYIDSSKDPILKNCPLLSSYLPSAFVFSQQATGLLQDASLSHPKRIKFNVNNLGSISTEKEAIRARLMERLISRSPPMSRPEKCTLEHGKKRT